MKTARVPNSPTFPPAPISPFFLPLPPSSVALCYIKPVLPAYKHKEYQDRIPFTFRANRSEMCSDQEAPKDASTYATESIAAAQSSGRLAEEMDELQESRKKALRLLEELAERTSDLEKLNSHYAHILKGIYASMQRRLQSEEEGRPAA